MYVRPGDLRGTTGLQSELGRKQHPGAKAAPCRRQGRTRYTCSCNARSTTQLMHGGSQNQCSFNARRTT
eukprot:scaffold252192_cov15-Tisochrysis_lutea.AAC.1